MNVILSERLTETLLSWRTIKHEGEYYDLRLDLNLINHRVDGYETGCEINFTGNFFDLRDGEISFHPHPENQITMPNNRWSRDGRNIIKIGRLAQLMIKYLRINFPDGSYDVPFLNGNDLHKKLFLRYCEQLSNQVRASVCNDEIQISDLPSNVYGWKTWTDGDTGSLGSSCMRPESGYRCHEGAWHYNEWKPKIAYILSQDGELRSRALIWENIITANGKTITFMDRIYGSDTHQEHMKNYAEAQGWWYKITQDSCSNNITNGTETDHAISVKVPDWTQNGRIPYMDTFITADDNVLWTNGNGKWGMQNTNAMFERKVSCARCGNDYTENSLREIDGERLCPDCVIFDEWNQCHISRSYATRYYDRYGNRYWVDRRHTQNLVLVNVNGISTYCVPL